MKKNDKIYVAGHNGMVGSAIVRELKKQGYTNIISRTHSELDLTRQADVEAFFEKERPDYVFVAAAKVGGIKANSTYPVEFGLINMQIACNVIESAYKNSVKKLLYLGSACIYPNDCEFPIKEEQLLSGCLEPTNEAYALAKCFGIRLCEYYKKEYGADFIAVQPSNCYGENDSFDPVNSHVIPALIRKYHEAKLNGVESIELWGTGAPKREFIYVDDLANACVFLMNNYSGDTMINIGTSVETSILELTKIISDTVGYTGKIICDTSKPDGKMRNVIDSSRLFNMGWRPQYTIESGIKKLYDWYLTTIS